MTIDKYLLFTLKIREKPRHNGRYGDSRSALYDVALFLDHMHYSTGDPVLFNYYLFSRFIRNVVSIIF